MKPEKLLYTASKLRIGNNTEYFIDGIMRRSFA